MPKTMWDVLYVGERYLGNVIAGVALGLVALTFMPGVVTGPAEGLTCNDYDPCPSGYICCDGECLEEGFAPDGDDDEEFEFG